MIKSYGDVRFRWEWKDTDDWIKKYSAQRGDFEAWASGMSFFTYLEGVGVLVQQGLLDINLVENLMADRIVEIWDKWEPLIKDIRKMADPKYYDHIEYLYNEMKKRQQ